jgi:uncharacterized membrane protein YidH (DUF202 family)
MDKTEGTTTSLANERTSLASERTQLAWWRTGLGALAVAVAVGSIVPDLSDDLPRWPCAMIGVGFALYGMALFAYGTARARQIDAALLQEGSIPPHGHALSALTAVGMVLAAATAVLIAFA